MSISGNILDHLSLVERARGGDKQSMESLALIVKERLFPYLYRLTLDYDLAEDLLQEALLEMVKSLWLLKKVNRFWPWIFRTALGKAQHHFREKKRMKLNHQALLERENVLNRGYVPQDGLTELVRTELSDAICNAMKNLKLKHRNVLALRCFEQMPYAQIGQVLNCSELQSRVMFYRAKQNLKRELFNKGFCGKRFMLLALSLFGLITVPAKAATKVVSKTVIANSSAIGVSTIEVGSFAALIGAATTKLGMLVTTFISSTIVYFIIENIALICTVLLVGASLFLVLTLFTLLSFYSYITN